jgi:hypothetical protein
MAAFKKQNLLGVEYALSHTLPVRSKNLHQQERFVLAAVSAKCQVGPRKKIKN